MADLLTHALTAFSIGTILSWKFERLNPHLITMFMIGSVLPDLTRIGLILDPVMIEDVSGVPFSWQALHTVGGVIIVTAILTQFFDQKEAKLTFLFTGIGAASHLFLDSFLLRASGRSYTMFFPITTYNPPLPGFYLSSDIWPSLIALLAAALVWKIDISYYKEKV